MITLIFLFVNHFSALNVPDETDGELSDGSISMLSGGEFIKEIDDHTPMSSLPPSPPASPPQPFWMRAHRPELALALKPRDLIDDLPRNTQQLIHSEKRISQYKNDTGLSDSKASNQPNVFNVFLFAITGFAVVIFSVLLAQYFSSIVKINQLKEIIHNLEVENAKLNLVVDGCRRSDLAYNGSGPSASDMQVQAKDNAPVTTEEEFKQINEIKESSDGQQSYEEPIGRKVWTGDGFILQATHLAPKKQFKYEDLCDKKIRDDLFSEYTSEYCEKVRQTKNNGDTKKTPVHKHQLRGENGGSTSAEVIFTEDFIDPNKFNNDMGQIYNEVERQFDQLMDEDSDDDDDDFGLQEPPMDEDTGIIPNGYASFEDVLMKMDEHMERISFYTQSCYTKYKKLKEDDAVSRKALKKAAQKTNKKQKRDGKKDEKYEKRERKYQEKKSKNYKRN